MTLIRKLLCPCYGTMLLTAVASLQLVCARRVLCLMLSPLRAATTASPVSEKWDSMAPASCASASYRQTWSPEQISDATVRIAPRTNLVSRLIAGGVTTYLHSLQRIAKEK